MGVVDSFTFGVRRLLPKIPGDDTDPCSLAYRLGEDLPLFVGGARLAYAGLAKTIPMVYRGATQEMASQAVNARNALKRIFRFGLGGENRIYPPDQMLAKYGNPESVIQAASRTNQSLNGLGAAAAAGSVINKVSSGTNCDCK
jgi:hypothetical protein